MPEPFSAREKCPCGYEVEMQGLPAKLSRDWVREAITEHFRNCLTARKLRLHRKED